MVWGAISRQRTYPLVRVETTMTGEDYAKMIKEFMRK